MFKTVLRNLISNAIKFSNSKGKINVFAEKIAENVIVTVSDNGIGIDKNIVDKLFDLTRKQSTTGTADEKGTGLGLIICKEFVEKHNGKIWVESELGKGSNFKFSIPIHND
jgi:signal transduction histidine kinase